MRLINKHKCIVRNVIKQGRRRITGRTPGQIARVVLNARAVAQLLHHLKIVLGALLQSLSFYQKILFAVVFKALFQLFFDAFNGIQNFLSWRHVVGFRVHSDTRQTAIDLTSERIERA